ncbi:MAG: hypothetical protein KAS66_14155 [Candidatus Omnitrophica bacterium]|nr:hypothetical protein [Candidatus Omnitrophota bacterium]
MTRNILVSALLLTVCATPALAARSVTKAYKISVSLPAAVEMPDKSAAEKNHAAPKIRVGQTTEKMVIASQNQKILLRTTVVR